MKNCLQRKSINSLHNRIWRMHQENQWMNRFFWGMEVITYRKNSLKKFHNLYTEWKNIDGGEYESIMCIKLVHVANYLAVSKAGENWYRLNHFQKVNSILKMICSGSHIFSYIIIFSYHVLSIAILGKIIIIMVRYYLICHFKYPNSMKNCK